MNRRALLAGLPAAALLTGLSPAGARTPAKPRGPSDAALAAQMISRIRAASGYGPVTVDARMNAAAAFQARAVAQLGRLDHGDFGGRIRRFGIGGTAAENLAYGTPDVAGAIAQWQNSGPHLRNLLLPSATRIGLGRAERGGLRYWALVIG